MQKFVSSSYHLPHKKLVSKDWTVIISICVDVHFPVFLLMSITFYLPNQAWGISHHRSHIPLNIWLCVLPLLSPLGPQPQILRTPGKKELAKAFKTEVGIKIGERRKNNWLKRARLRPSGQEWGWYQSVQVHTYLFLDFVTTQNKYAWILCVFDFMLKSCGHRKK